jgi:hemerythrin superfamily protein
MKALAKRFSPSATDLLRADHTRVVAVFHRYAAELSPRVKQGLVQSACLMLEIHAQIEEEIFYPAMRAADTALVEKSVPEHDAIRVLAAALRGMEGADPDYDETFLTLMRAVLHHVADEETRLFPDAERLFPEDLPRLGAQMAKRRLQLGAPRVAPFAGIAVAAAGLLATALIYRQASRRSGSAPASS